MTYGLPPLCKGQPNHLPAEASCIVPTIYENAPAYLRTFPLSRRRGGSGEYEVYLAPHLIVKKLSWDRLASVGFAVANRGGHPGSFREFERRSRAATDSLFQLKFDQLFEIKQRLGDLVVPYEIPDQANCRVKHWCGLWREAQTFYRPAVQHRVLADDILDRRLALLRSTGDFKAMERLIDGAFDLMQRLVGRGFFPHDNQSGNYCLWQGAVVLFDLGAVWKLGRNVQGVLMGDEDVRRAYIEHNKTAWVHALRSPVALRASPEEDRLVTRFTERFDDFNRWRTVITHRNRGGVTPVPNVFPLSV